MSTAARPEPLSRTTLNVASPGTGNEPRCSRPGWTILATVVCAVAMGSLSCAFGEIRAHDPMDRQLSLEDRHKDYTDLVRWSKFRAAAAFVKPEARSEFLKQMPDADEVRFTDWEAEEWEFEDPETMDRAIIEVRYRGYSMNRPFEVKVHEQQEWTREGRSNHWNVVSRFLDLETLVGPHSAAASPRQTRD